MNQRVLPSRDTEIALLGLEVNASHTEKLRQHGFVYIPLQVQHIRVITHTEVHNLA